MTVDRTNEAMTMTQATPGQADPAGFGMNEWLVQEKYQAYLADPASVDAVWQEFFAGDPTHGGEPVTTDQVDGSAPPTAPNAAAPPAPSAVAPTAAPAAAPTATQAAPAGPAGPAG